MRVVDREVSGRHELAAVVQASQRESDLPILFRKVAGSRYPAISNIYGSRPRLLDMIGATDGSFCRRWVELMRAPPKPVEAADDEDGTLEEIRLAELPQITYFERDAGPYITSGVFLAKDPETGVPNLSFPSWPDHQRQRTESPARHLARSDAVSAQGGSRGRGTGGGDSRGRASGSGARGCSADPLRPERVRGSRQAHRTPAAHAPLPHHRARRAGRDRDSLSRGASCPTFAGRRDHSASSWDSTSRSAITTSSR